MASPIKVVGVLLRWTAPIIVIAGGALVARQQQRLAHVRLTLIAGNPIGKRGAVLNNPRRKMRHDFEAIGV